MSAVKPLLPTRCVVDAPTRMFHWLFALCFAGAYLTSESERVQVVHASFGYAIVALLVFRLMYGWFGPRPVRWSSLITKLRGGIAWYKSINRVRNVAGSSLRAGQNFALVLATSILMILPIPLIWSGHILFVNTSDFLEDVHELLANAMLFLVLIHLSLILLLSVKRDSNLMLSMWSGCVPGPGPDLIADRRSWLAFALLLFTISFGSWAVL